MALISPISILKWYRTPQVRLAKLKGVIMEEVFKALDKYFENVNKSDIPNALETLVGQYVEHANVYVDWIEIY